MVDLLHNLDRLAEDKSAELPRALARARWITASWRTYCAIMAPPAPSGCSNPCWNHIRSRTDAAPGDSGNLFSFHPYAR